MKEKKDLLMTRFIGTKEVYAKPLTKEEYCDYRAWGIPKDEDPDEKGYLVEYIDSKNSNHKNHEGYISWTPEVAFKAAYRSDGNLTFGHAIVALKQGKRVARKGWNGKGLFIFMQVPSNISMDTVPNMQSLPESVKVEFANRRYHMTPELGKDANIRYRNQLAMVYPDNTIYGWVASPSDVLEEDWVILD